MAKHHGVGQTQDASRLALRLPALCGAPTREEAQEVLRVSVARQRELTAQFTSLTQQRREVFGHPERLETLGLSQGQSYVELIPRAKNRENHETIVNISKGYKNRYGPHIGPEKTPCVVENIDLLDLREAHWTRGIQKPVNG
jgi:hypothetical protein